jgi:hypothetical protein
MRRCTGLQSDQASGSSSKPHHLAAPQLLADNNLLVAIYSKHLKHVLKLYR